MSQKKKELLTRNKKYFSSFLKGFQLSEITSDPKVSLSRYNNADLKILVYARAHIKTIS